MTPQQNKENSWIQVFTGNQFFPTEPKVKDVRLIDIAHSLSMQCRFTGHCKDFYSVAEHSVRVSRILDPEFALWGLLHDASEAYLTDMSRPVKISSVLGDEYRKIETRLMEVIAQRFGLSWPEPPEVKIADNVLLMTEKRDLLQGGACLPKWQETAEPLKEVIQPWDWRRAKAHFLNRFTELTQNLQ